MAEERKAILSEAVERLVESCGDNLRYDANHNVWIVFEAKEAPPDSGWGAIRVQAIKVTEDMYWKYSKPWIDSLSFAKRIRQLAERDARIRLQKSETESMIEDVMKIVQREKKAQ